MSASALTPRMQNALRLLALSGSARVTPSPQVWRGNEIANRTAAALERRGYVERVWTGPDAGRVVITARGRVAADELEMPRCPHGCGPLRFVEDQYICPVCEDEWDLTVGLT